MPRTRLASAALLLVLAFALGAATLLHLAAAPSSPRPAVADQRAAATAPATSGPDDMYWD